MRPYNPVPATPWYTARGLNEMELALAVFDQFHKLKYLTAEGYKLVWEFEGLRAEYDRYRGKFLGCFIWGTLAGWNNEEFLRELNVSFSKRKRLDRYTWQ